VSLKANCRHSVIGVFLFLKVFLVQYKDLTGITSILKWGLLHYGMSLLRLICTRRKQINWSKIII